MNSKLNSPRDLSQVRHAMETVANLQRNTYLEQVFTQLGIFGYAVAKETVSYAEITVDTETTLTLTLFTLDAANANRPSVYTITFETETPGGEATPVAVVTRRINPCNIVLTADAKSTSRIVCSNVEDSVSELQVEVTIPLVPPQVFDSHHNRFIFHYVRKFALNAGRSENLIF